MAILGMEYDSNVWKYINFERIQEYGVVCDKCLVLKNDREQKYLKVK